MGPVAFIRVVQAGLLGLVAVALVGCPAKEIPPHFHRGELVFSDDFERDELGSAWKPEGADWRIEDGWAHSAKALNKGLWLTQSLPEDVIVEFDARSEPVKGAKTFAGDIKCEVFATAPKHETGYVIINNGWAWHKNGPLDKICRLTEHDAPHKQRKVPKGAEVKPSVVYHWMIARLGPTVYWFRDGKLQLSFKDDSPVRGTFFGFNNWEASVYFDNLKIYAMAPQ